MQRITQLTGTHIRWKKSESTKVWSAGIPTEHGIRWVSTHQTEKAKAVEMIRELRLQWLGTDKFQKQVHAAISGCKKITVERAIIEWADSRRKFGALSEGTVREYVKRLTTFARKFNLVKEHPTLITIDHVYEFVNQNGKMSTRNTRLAALKAWFGWLICEHYAVTNYPESMKRIDMSKMTHEEKEPERKPPFTEEQFSQLLKHIKDCIGREQINRDIQNQTGENYGYSVAERLTWLRFWQTAARIGWLTGLRIGDVAQLEWASVVDLAVWTQKADTRVALEQELNTICLSIPREDERFCFPQARVRYQSNSSQLSGQFRKLCQGAGLEGYSFHSLRRTKAQALQAEGKTTPEIAERLGHSSTRTTEVYLTPSTSPPSS